MVIILENLTLLEVPFASETSLTALCEIPKPAPVCNILAVDIKIPIIPIPSGPNKIATTLFLTKPIITLNDGLKDTYQWFLKNKNKLRG